MGHFDTKFAMEKYRKPQEERRKQSVEELD